MEESIVKVWFDDDRIFILTDRGHSYSRFLDSFPRLKNATARQRAEYEIGIEGDDLRWEEIDEDIHISSFIIQ